MAVEPQRKEKKRELVNSKKRNKRQCTGDSRQRTDFDAGSSPSGCVSAKAESKQVNVADGRPFINEEIHQTSSCFADVTCVSGSRVVERSAGQFTPINSDDVIVANWQVSCQQGPIKLKKKKMNRFVYEMWHLEAKTKDVTQEDE